jgi:hypothetical protein
LLSEHNLPNHHKNENVSNDSAPNHRLIVLYKSNVFLDRSVNAAHLRALQLPLPIETHLKNNYPTRRYNARCDYSFFSRPSGYVTNSIITIDPNESFYNQLKCVISSALSVNGFHVGNDIRFPTISEILLFFEYLSKRSHCLFTGDGALFFQCLSRSKVRN